MKVKALFTVPLLLGVLAGCGDNDSNTDPDTNTAITTDRDEVVTNPATTNGAKTDNSAQTDGQGEGQQQIDTEYNFTNFDLDVEYADDASYNAEYTNTQNKISAELEDEIINKVKFSGDDAFNQIAPSLALLKFDEKTEDQEVLNQVLEAFGLEDNYKEFELEVKFQNGQEKEYKFGQ